MFLATKNGCIVAGYVPKDAEVKTSQNGKTYAKFSIKAMEKPPTVEGERGEAVWTNCIAWHDLARIAGNIKKGMNILAAGKIETSEYEGKTYKTLNCEYIGVPGVSAAPQAPQAAASDVPEGFEELLTDDDMPF